jgi:hypothetical protein
MNKLLKALTSVMLAVFCSVCIVGICWGTEKAITAPRLIVPDYVDTGKSFPIKIYFDKDTYSSGKYYLHIGFPEQFGQDTIDIQITKEAYELTASAPSLEANCVIQFDIYEQSNSSIWAGSSEVSVILDKSPTTSSVVGGFVVDIITFPFKFAVALLTAPGWAWTYH